MLTEHTEHTEHSEHTEHMGHAEHEDHEHRKEGDIDSIHTEIRNAEERRRSMLDHHWAIPSKDRSMDGEDTPPSSASLMPTIRDEAETLTKQSCHDSG